MIRRGWQQFQLRRALRAVSGFWHHKSLSDGLASLSPTPGNAPYRQLALEGQAACAHHSEHHDDLHGQISLSEWLTESLRGAIDDSSDRLQAGLPMLASIGATAPFVGLLGTVWGIYHALMAIGIAGQSSIDKVAGPVGEALIMTAAGLFVAIPAVLGYNALSRANRRTLGHLQRFARQLHNYFLTGQSAGSNVRADATGPSAHLSVITRESGTPREVYPLPREA